MPLPPGQFEIADFPRFGLPPFANRFPDNTEEVRLEVTGDIGKNIGIASQLADVSRVCQTSDFHCVVSWSVRNLAWEGYRFRDVYQQLIVPAASPAQAVTHAILFGQDRYAACLALEDLMADDVLLADRLNGVTLPVEHGAPIRLIAPAHYGYKSVKHISGIKLISNIKPFRSPRPAFLVHPRGHVACEERGSGIPGWLLRYAYRPLYRINRKLFERAVRKYRARKAEHIAKTR